MAGFRDRGRTPPSLRLIPHPAVTLLLVFGGTIAVADSTGQRHHGNLVAGLGFGEALRAVRATDFECLQIRLPPVVANAVLGGAVADLGRAVLTLDDLRGRETERISEQLAELSSWPERFALADAWLARGWAEASPVPSELRWAWQRILASRGTVRIEHLAAELGWSRKRLWSGFQSQLGLPPKYAAKLVRFDHAVHNLVAGRAAADVAADGGYTDQSHLHRDVAAFSGLTPATVVDEPFLAVDDLAWGW